MRSVTAAALKTIGIRSETDICLFESKAEFRKVCKDEILLHPGEVCKAIFFTVRGAIYQYKCKDEIEENVIDLHTDREWFFNHRSFVSQKPSDSYIKAYTDSEVVAVDIESLHYLIGKSPAFLQVAKIVEQATARVHFFDNRFTPAQKYQYVVEHRRELIQQFPLKLIASYLKMTPETLSRVREKLSKGKIIS